MSGSESYEKETEYTPQPPATVVDYGCHRPSLAEIKLSSPEKEDIAKSLSELLPNVDTARKVVEQVLLNHPQLSPQFFQKLNNNILQAEGVGYMEEYMEDLKNQDLRYRFTYN